MDAAQPRLALLQAGHARGGHQLAPRCATAGDAQPRPTPVFLTTDSWPRRAPTARGWPTTVCLENLPCPCSNLAPSLALALAYPLISAQADPAQTTATDSLPTVQVQSARNKLDAARNGLSPDTGSTIYKFSRDDIAGCRWVTTPP
jgi:hypothetical protein